jgi:hypothetical protein
VLTRFTQPRRRDARPPALREGTSRWRDTRRQDQHGIQTSTCTGAPVLDPTCESRALKARRTQPSGGRGKA